MSQSEFKIKEEAYDHLSGTVYRWKVLTATFLAYFYDSFDLVILAIAMPVLIKILGITLPEGGLLASSTMIGAALGSILIGLLAENWGRKKAIMLSLSLFGIGTGCVYFIETWGQWMILRFLTGVAIGGAWGPCVALISMHWSPRYRSRAGAFMLSTFALGAIAASFVGRLVLSVDWRLMFLVGATAVFVPLYVWWAVPDDGPESSKKKSTSVEVKEKVTLGSILVGETGRRLVMATLLNVFIMAGVWGALTWIPTFLVKERGLSLVMMANFSVFMYIGMFIGYQCHGYLGDRYGRKKSIMIGFLVCVISIPVYIIVQNGTFLFWWGMVVGYGYGGPLGVVGAYYAELFPENIRALTGGFCFNVGRIGAVVAPFTVGVLGKMYGLNVGLIVASCMSLIGIFVLMFLPETGANLLKSEK
jgi:MFS family permease